MTMTEEELNQLRRFYAYRQKPHLRAVLLFRLKDARRKLDDALKEQKYHNSAHNTRYIAYQRAEIQHIREQIKELDTMGVFFYERRTKSAK